MAGSTDVSFEIRQFIGEELRREIGVATDTDSLLEAGILDSLGVVELVAFIERQYGFRVTEDEMMPENFETIEAIAAFVRRSRADVD